MENRKPRNVFGAAVLFQGMLVLVALGLGWNMTPRPQDRIAWNAEGLAWGIAATVPLLGVFFASRVVPLRPLRNLKRLVDEMIVQLFDSCTLPQLAMIAILAGLGEELLFRGLLQPYLVEQMGPLLAVVLTSVLFGLLHAITPTYAVLAALIGAYFSWISIATANLLPAIIAHALYDFLVLAYLSRSSAAAAEAPQQVD